MKALEAHVANLKEECTDAKELVSHLSSVSKLITSSITCPGVGELKLATPSNICHANGITCTWRCSGVAQIFATGEKYGHYQAILNVPKSNVDEGRAYCEEHCIRDIHCVGFTHHQEHGECLLKMDVLNGDFSPEPGSWVAGAGAEFNFYACYIIERVDLANRFRDQDNPVVSQAALSAFWWDHNKAPDPGPGGFLFHYDGLDASAKDFMENVGSEASEVRGVEPVLATAPQNLKIDKCGCPPGMGWELNKKICQAGEITSPEEGACCGEDSLPGKDEDGKPFCVDACACAPGLAWRSDAQICTDTDALGEKEETTHFEGSCCFAGKIPQQDPDTKTTICLDSCGCGPGNGWSGDRRQCEAGKTTNADEADCCNDGKVPGLENDRRSICESVSHWEEKKEGKQLRGPRPSATLRAAARKDAPKRSGTIYLG